jgi:hypothetical protein
MSEVCAENVTAGAGVMIKKLFSPKKIGEKLAFLDSKYYSCL